MSKKQKPESKKQEKVDKKVEDKSSSAAHVAGFLLAEFNPKEAMRIVSGMEQAATAKSMKRRMGKIKTAVASASASASASAAA
jgi:hypothetical protein